MGVEECVDGTIYNGHWVEDKKSGEGYCKLPDGTEYDGKWEDNVLVFRY